MRRRKGRAAFVVTLALACLLALAGCAGDPAVPVGLVVDPQDGLSKTTYDGGETFNPDGLVVKVFMSDGSRKDVPVDDLSYKLGGKILTRSTIFSSDDVGEDQVVTASYRGLEDTFNITVSDLTVSSIEIGSEPDKKDYFPGVAELDLTGLSVKVTMSDGSSKIVDWTPREGHNGITTDPANGTKIIGDTTVTVIYGDKLTSFSAQVPALESISVSSLPSKRNYKTRETFSADGLVLALTYNTGSTYPMAYKPGSDMTFVGSSLEPLTPGETLITKGDTVTVTYGGFSDTFDILFNAEKTVTGMKIKGDSKHEGPYTADFNAGEYQWPEDMLLDVTYDDGTVGEVFAEDFSGTVNLKTAGVYTVTVTYEGFEDTYDVTVEEAVFTDKVLTNMSIEDAETRWNSRRYLLGTYKYPVGEMKLVLEYDDGSKQLVSATEANFEGTDLSKLNEAGTHTVKVSYPSEDTTVEREFQIIVEKLPLMFGSGTVLYGTALKFSDVVDGIEIRYTTDGSTPAEGSTLYEAAKGIVVDKSMTVKAKAYLTDTTYEDFPVYTEAVLGDGVTVQAQLRQPDIHLYNHSTKQNYTNGIADVVMTKPSAVPSGAKIQYRTSPNMGETWSDWKDYGSAIEYGSSKPLSIEAKVCAGGFIESVSSRENLSPYWEVGDRGPNGGYVSSASIAQGYWEILLSEEKVKKGSTIHLAAGTRYVGDGVFTAEMEQALSRYVEEDRAIREKVFEYIPRQLIDTMDRRTEWWLRPLNWFSSVTSGGAATRSYSLRNVGTSDDFKIGLALGMNSQELPYLYERPF